jgi:hypothetical protein
VIDIYPSEAFYLVVQPERKEFEILMGVQPAVVQITGTLRLISAVFGQGQMARGFRLQGLHQSPHEIDGADSVIVGVERLPLQAVCDPRRHRAYGKHAQSDRVSTGGR